MTNNGNIYYWTAGLVLAVAVLLFVVASVFFVLGDLWSRLSSCSSSSTETIGKIRVTNYQKCEVISLV